MELDFIASANMSHFFPVLSQEQVESAHVHPTLAGSPNIFDLLNLFSKSALTLPSFAQWTSSPEFLCCMFDYLTLEPCNSLITNWICYMAGKAPEIFTRTVLQWRYPMFLLDRDPTFSGVRSQTENVFSVITGNDVLVMKIFQQQGWSVKSVGWYLTSHLPTLRDTPESMNRVVCSPTFLESFKLIPVSLWLDTIRHVALLYQHVIIHNLASFIEEIPPVSGSSAPQKIELFSTLFMQQDISLLNAVLHVTGACLRHPYFSSTVFKTSIMDIVFKFCAHSDSRLRSNSWLVVNLLANNSRSDEFVTWAVKHGVYNAVLVSLRDSDLTVAHNCIDIIPHLTVDDQMFPIMTDVIPEIFSSTLKPVVYLVVEYSEFDGCAEMLIAWLDFILASSANHTPMIGFLLTKISQMPTNSSTRSVVVNYLYRINKYVTMQPSEPMQDRRKIAIGKLSSMIKAGL